MLHRGFQPAHMGLQFLVSVNSNGVSLPLLSLLPYEFIVLVAMEFGNNEDFFRIPDLPRLLARPKNRGIFFNVLFFFCFRKKILHSYSV